MPNDNVMLDPDWWLEHVHSIAELNSLRYPQETGSSRICNHGCTTGHCLWNTFRREHCAPDWIGECTHQEQEADLQRFLQSLRWSEVRVVFPLEISLARDASTTTTTPKTWTVGEIVDWINSACRTTEELTRPLVKLYERQTPSEQILGHTVQRNAVGFNFKDSRTVEEVLNDLRADPHYELSVVGMEGLKKILTRYRRQLTDIANQGA